MHMYSKEKVYTCIQKLACVFYLVICLEETLKVTKEISVNFQLAEILQVKL